MRDGKYEKKTGRTGRRGALLAVIVLIAGLILSPALSRATEAAGSECSLTVLLDFSDTDDVDKANVVVDLYKVADMVQDPNFATYNFDVPNGPFYEVEDILENMKDLDSTRYKMVANTAAKAALELKEDAPERVVKENPVGSEHKITGLEPGLYLMITRGKGMAVEDYRKSSEEDPEQVVTVAYSPRNKYSFLPQLVALPNTVEKILPDQEIKTSDGEWKDDVTAVLKGSVTENLSRVKIVKNLTTYESRQPATFVFSIKAVLDGKSVYSNVVSLTFTPEEGAGSKDYTTPYVIPVGSTVTVEEIYSGANYSIKATKNEPDPLIVRPPAEAPVTATFTNDFGDTDKGSGAITNKFSYVQNEKGEMVWKLDPVNTKE